MWSTDVGSPFLNFYRDFSYSFSHDKILHVRVTSCLINRVEKQLPFGAAVKTKMLSDQNAGSLHLGAIEAGKALCVLI